MYIYKLKLHDLSSLKLSAQAYKEKEREEKMQINDEITVCMHANNCNTEQGIK